MANNEFNNLPNLIKNPKSALDAFARALEGDILSSVQEQASNDGLEVKRMPKYLILTERKMKDKGIIDLKQAFSRSSKRKYTKNGDWYLIIPIAVKRRAISKRAYNELKNAPLSSGKFTNTHTAYLYDKSPSYSSAVPSVNAMPKTNNVTITRQKWGNNFRRNYTAFRTVSAKSPVGSWIMNRQNVNSQNFSPTMLKNIDRLMSYRMRNLN